MATIISTHTVKFGNEELSLADSNTAGTLITLTESIADATTDGLIAFVADVSQMKAFIMWADGTLLIETNSGSAPADTFALVVNEFVFWSTGKLFDTNPLGTDVTALFATNASGSAIELNIRMLIDPTI